MNDFYVYIEDFDSTYEPAEGGYYVPISTIRKVEKHHYLNDAYETYNSFIEQVEDEYQEKAVFSNNQKVEFVEDEDGDIYLYTPFASIGCNGYIGSGSKVGISTSYPEGIRYNGYC